jgi:hypothetical protein
MSKATVKRGRKDIDFVRWRWGLEQACGSAVMPEGYVT